MKNYTILFLFFSIISFSQTQIGPDIDGEASGDESGYSVSLSNDGSIIAVGAPTGLFDGIGTGYVRVFENNTNNWNQLGQIIEGEVAGDNFGYKISLSGDGSILAVGAYYNNGNGSNSGHVRVFQYNGSSWIQLGNDIDSEASGDESGYSVSLSDNGSILAIGARYNDGNGFRSGHVRIFQYNGSSWNQLGSDIDGESSGDQTGYSVSLSNDGTIVAIGATENDGNGSNSGHVRIFQYDGTSWNQMGNDIDGESSFDLSGYSISLSGDGNIVAIGARINGGNGYRSGHARIFQYDETSWNQMGSDINGEFSNDFCGESLSLSSNGSVLALGASFNDGNGVDSGHVRIFQYNGSSWNQIGSDIDGEAASDFSGISVSLSESGSTIAIGARGNDGNGDLSGHTRVYNLSELLTSDDLMLSKLKLYPIPSSDKLTIELDNKTQLRKANLYNNLGQFINTFKSNTLNLSNLSNGFYFLEIFTNKGQTIKKIIKE